MRIIINADDLGADFSINEAIRKFAENNYISSATILANGDGFNGVKDVINSCPQISYGVHLNLTEFKSLTNSNILQEVGIIDANNDFQRKFRLTKIKYKPFVKEAIYFEWKAQIVKLKDYGIQPSHIDGHHHIHAYSEFYSILVKLQKEFNIKKVRNRYRKPLNTYFSKQKRISGLIQDSQLQKNVLNNAITEKQNILNRKISKSYHLAQNEIWYNNLKIFHNTKLTDYFFSYTEICNFIKNSNSFPANCTIEVMTHPGLELYSDENALIVNKGLYEFINKFELITYSEL